MGLPFDFAHATASPNNGFPFDFAQGKKIRSLSEAEAPDFREE